MGSKTFNLNSIYYLNVTCSLSFYLYYKKDLCSESRSDQKIEYQKPQVLYEQTLNNTTFTIVQGSYYFLQGNVVVNAHQSPYGQSPIVKQAKQYIDDQTKIIGYKIYSIIITIDILIKYILTQNRLGNDLASKQTPPIGEIEHTEINGQLNYQHILHASLPCWQTCEDVTEVQGKLYDTYQKVLEKADELLIESIVFTDLTLPPMQIPVGLHAECLIGAVILYIEENQSKTNIKNVTFVNQEKTKNQRYTYQLQSKLVGINEDTVKDKIRQSISEACGYNSLSQKAHFLDENQRSLQGSAAKNMCETEGSTLHQSKQQLDQIDEHEQEREELEAENKLKKEMFDSLKKHKNNHYDIDEDELIDSRHFARK